jgi:hypothetical protein
MAKRAGGYRARYGKNDKPLLLLAAACTPMPRNGALRTTRGIVSIDWRNRALPRSILNNSTRMIRDDFARDRKHQSNLAIWIFTLCVNRAMLRHICVKLHPSRFPNPPKVSRDQWRVRCVARKTHAYLSISEFLRRRTSRLTARVLQFRIFRIIYEIYF